MVRDLFSSVLFGQDLDKSVISEISDEVNVVDGEIVGNPVNFPVFSERNDHVGNDVFFLNVEGAFVVLEILIYEKHLIELQVR